MSFKGFCKLHVGGTLGSSEDGETMAFQSHDTWGPLQVFSWWWAVTSDDTDYEFLLMVCGPQ